MKFQKKIIYVLKNILANCTYCQLIEEVNGIYISAIFSPSVKALY